MSNHAHVKLVETNAESEAIKDLRVQVFVREQGAPLDEEFDEHDESAVHAVALIEARVVGTGRMYELPSGETQIGRMAVEPRHRRDGIGGLMLVFLEAQARQRGVREVMLHAQTYVQSFYERHGYIVDGKPFMEVDIEHVRMVKRLE
ncbi:MAG: GNAT family N-acetyltransferase [Chloroflexi bacterium]|nr:GNAT family N-acetyltransferase [Chloroflexota bacterium]